MNENRWFNHVIPVSLRLSSAARICGMMVAVRRLETNAFMISLHLPALSYLFSEVDHKDSSYHRPYIRLDTNLSPSIRFQVGFH
jgi:hypothetical protein